MLGYTLCGNAWHDAGGPVQRGLKRRCSATTTRSSPTPISPPSRIEGWYRRKDGTRFPVGKPAVRALADQGRLDHCRERERHHRAQGGGGKDRAAEPGLRGAQRHQRRHRTHPRPRRIIRRGLQDCGGTTARCARPGWAWVDREKNEVNVVAWQGGDESFVESLRGRTSMQLDASGEMVCRGERGPRQGPCRFERCRERPQSEAAKRTDALGINSLAVLPMLLAARDGRGADVACRGDRLFRRPGDEAARWNWRATSPLRSTTSRRARRWTTSLTTTN
jgi:hypothetical protein